MDTFARLFPLQRMSCLTLVCLFALLGSAGSCSIFSSLNCSCFHSDVDPSASFYSHLFCQGRFSSRRPFDFPLAEDLSLHNRFRTVTLEFALEGHVEVLSDQFSNLSWLFVSTPRETPVEISLRFNGFTRLTLHRSSLTTNISQSTHFQFSFLPSRSNDSLQVRRNDEQT